MKTVLRSVFGALFLVLTAGSVLAAPTWIRVDKAAFRLELMDGTKVIRSWPVAIGRGTGDKTRVGDDCTPEGSFTVQQVQPASTWAHDFGDGKGPIAGAYGPWFIRLRTGRWKGIGIHGTHDPASIGTRASEGCIRMRNEDLAQLEPLVKVGMKVRIAAGEDGTSVTLPPMGLAVSPVDGVVTPQIVEPSVEVPVSRAKTERK